MTSIGGPCQCEVCGEWCRGGNIMHGAKCPWPSRQRPTRCDCERACIRCHASDPATIAYLCGPCLQVAVAPIRCARCGSGAEGVEAPGQHLLVCGPCHGEISGEALAAAEGRAAGYRMRALLAEAERDEAYDHGWVDAAAVQLEHAAEAERRAYTIGRRDGLACAAQRDALVGDVVEAAKAWRVARMLRAPTGFERYCQLERAIDVLLAAEKPERTP
jgi:hypothetical protein